MSFVCVIVAQTNDFGSWLSVGMSKEYTKKIDFGASVETRFVENVSRLDVLFCELDASYKIVKPISVEVAYRAISSYATDDGYSAEHRFFLGLTGNVKLEDFKITYKARIQRKYSELYKGPDAEIQNTLRNKLSVKYTLKGTPYRPYAGVEIFNPISNQSFEPISKYRAMIGLNYLFNSKYSMSVFYLRQNEINTGNPLSSNVIGVGFEAEL